jgi:zinc/manganese transport system substrate-binding protein
MGRTLLCLLLIAMGLPSPAWARRAPLRVVTSVPSLASIAEEVGGARVTVESLSLATQDPHFVDARPHLALSLSRADLLMEVGLELEVGWLPVLQTGSRNAHIQTGAEGHLDCSAFVELREVPTTRIDRAMGDVHPGGNPHYLIDPRSGAAVARALADRLASLDPDGAEIYRQGAEAFAGRATALRNRLVASAEAVRGEPVVVYHESWTYLVALLGLDPIGTVEPKPGISPTPAHVARLIDTMRAHEARLVLLEPFYPARTPELIAEEVGGEVLTLCFGPDLEAGETYLGHVEASVAAVIEALSREASP